MESRSACQLEWSKELENCRTKLEWLTESDKKKYVKMMDQLEDKIKGHTSRNASSYKIIKDGLERLEKEVPKLVWEGKLAKLHNRILPFAEDVKYKYLTQLIHVKKFISAHNKQQHNAKEIDLRLNQISDSIDSTVQQQSKLNVSHVESSSCSLTAAFCCFGRRKTPQQIEEENLEKQSLLLVSPVR